MSFISEFVTPFFKWYDRQLDGEYVATQLQFKGAREAGGDYLSKIERYQRRNIQKDYDETLESVNHPTFQQFTKDNILRLLLNPFDRLVAAYQAYPSMKARFHKPGTYSHTFTQILNEGAILGSFKGFIYNFAQFGLVLYPSVYFANKSSSESKFFTFFSTYTFLDALFYPLDTLKNILYADTLGHYSIKTVTTQTALNDLYRGLPLKLLFNIPVLSGIYCTTQIGHETQAAIAWAIAFALYPLNTQKVRAQVAGSALSSVTERTGQITHSNYRGAFTFIFLNALIGYALRPLLSRETLSEIEKDVKDRLKAERLD